MVRPARLSAWASTSAWASDGANVTGGANSGAMTPTAVAFELGATSARMSMSAEDSVTLGGGGAGASLCKAASEKSTLLSLRSPVSGDSCPFRRSVATVYPGRRAGDVGFISLSDPLNYASVGAKFLSNHQGFRDV